MSPPIKDPKGYLRKSREYQSWASAQARFRLGAGQPINAPPADYSFLARNPNHFATVRAAFELHWAIKRLTK